FDDDALAKGGKVQVMLLDRDVDAPEQAKTHQLGETFAFAPSALFWLPQGGVSDADLDLRALEKLVGIYTMRTQRTLQRLVKKYGE
ncbi:MAG: hypothetical protein AAF938_23015, partial [Myxococcota bacterium]